MDNWSVWQHLRFQTLSDMLLEDGALAHEQQSGRSGESVFPRGTLAFSYVDKGYENLKDVVQTLGWTYTCRATSQPEEPPGVAIGLTKDSTAAGGISILRQDLEQQLAESLRRFPAVVAAHQPALKDAMERTSKPLPPARRAWRLADLAPQGPTRRLSEASRLT
jgi:hypothetical protein